MFINLHPTRYRLMAIIAMAIISFATNAEKAPTIKINSIAIVVHDVFDNDIPKESGAFYKAVNYLHIQTREKTVRQQLEFREGDIITADKILETERVLRGPRYIRDARIDITGTNDKADLVVHVYDTWSTKIKVNLKSEGGSTNYELGLKEENLLGRGIGAGLSYKKDIDRSYSVLKLTKDHLFNGDLRLSGEYADTENGFIKDISLENPYRYFDNKSAFGFSFSYKDLPQSLYFQGESYYDFFQQKRDTNLFYSVNHLSDNLSFKHYFGWHQTEFVHDEAIDQPTIEDTELLAYTSQKDFIPKNNQLSYPFYQLSIKGNNYTKRQYFDSIGKQEDHHLGWDSSFKIGYIYHSEDIDKKRSQIEFSTQYAQKMPHNGLATGEINTSFRTDGKNLQNAHGRINLKYYLPESKHFLFFSQLQVAHSYKLDGGEQMLLGEDGEVRGYPSRFISADRIERLTFEQRYYNHNQVWRVFNFGCSLFVDFIHASGGNALEKKYNNHFQTVGFGLRVANNRSSLSDIIHLDFSAPINPPEGIDRFQINISSKKYF